MTIDLIKSITLCLEIKNKGEEEGGWEETERETHFVKKEKGKYIPWTPRPQHESYRSVKIGKLGQKEGQRIFPLPRKSKE